MGGQACVFYGAAQFSKDVDLLLFAEEDGAGSGGHGRLPVGPDRKFWSAPA